MAAIPKIMDTRWMGVKRWLRLLGWEL